MGKKTKQFNASCNLSYSSLHPNWLNNSLPDINFISIINYINNINKKGTTKSLTLV